MKFLFQLVRSKEKSHQVPSFRCASFVVNGELDANSITIVRDYALRLAVLPGVYDLIIRNAADDCEWKSFGLFDTRSPDQVPGCAKCSNRKPQTGAKRR